MERKEIEEEIAMQCIYAHYEENELFKTGALWGYNKAKQEPPTFEQYRKIAVIINGVRGYSEECLKLDYAKIKEHWND